MSSDQLNRELIRLANRERLDAGQVADLILYAQIVLSLSDVEPEEIVRNYVKSYEED